MWGMAPAISRKLFVRGLPLQAFRKHRAIPVALSGALARIGSLEVRLAATRKEVLKAQRLRFKVFFEEGGATPDAKAALTRRDADKFDAFCDHLIVIDHEGKSRRGKVKPTVVGAYRLLRSDVAMKKHGFYSASEYDLAPLLARHPGKRFLELGRSCVLQPYRGKKTIELLWRGILAYIRAYDIDALIGCASFEGANPLAHAASLSFLKHHAGASDAWCVRARRDLHVPMDMLDISAIDARRALAALPPLIKGYLRVGAKFGDGAVADHKFNTTDVFVVMPVAEMDTRYLEFFGSSSDRAA
ncbi:GNAT family N-acetyltransferase [Rhodoblastus acidophilus]|uniref:L-ornithine N(alpha)-acyltransferase n=1 Tax=Rhodoblastus acidophilus TaxID=1074 RepID=A0A6N8DLQ7_RHOAC|nr:GNAT family N-acyltransferase [Rhodoblastus acidophilus]MTV29704.1 GNAT family N-acetyltransferase [Rhodoblastus acidophilus]